MKAQGKREARRPGLTASTPDRGLKGRNTKDITPFQGSNVFVVAYQGRRATLRFALAPGCHIPRRWRSVPIEAKPPDSPDSPDDPIPR